MVSFITWIVFIIFILLSVPIANMMDKRSRKASMPDAEDLPPGFGDDAVEEAPIDEAGASEFGGGEFGTDGVNNEIGDVSFDAADDDAFAEFDNKVN